jgi:DKNYY family
VSQIIVKNNQVFLATNYGETRLQLSAQNFETLLEDTEKISHAAWVKNADGYFYVAGGKIHPVKTSHLTPINIDYAKNDTCVFWKNIALPNSHPDSFKLVETTHYFAVDQRQVYALSDSAEGVQIWDDVDMESLVFFPIGNPFFADKNHLYYFNWHFIQYENHFIEFERHELTDHLFYHWKDGDLVDTDLNEKQKSEIIAREGTFKRYLNHHHPNPAAWWARGDDYYKNLTLQQNNHFHDGRNIYIYVDKDDESQAISTNGKDYFTQIANTDLASFESLDAHYAKDKNAVYHVQRQLKQADVATFKSLGNNFAQDKQGIYFNGYFCVEADAASFEVINQKFARDKTQLYAATHNTKIGSFKGYAQLLCPLKNAHPDSFKAINSRWAADINNVYCFTKIWKEIDAASFEFLFEIDPNSWAKCKKGLYNANGRKVVKGVDGASFTMLNTFWGKDKNAVFCFKTERIASTIDVKSFEVLSDNGEAQDKNYQYYFDALYNIKKKVRK